MAVIVPFPLDRADEIERDLAEIMAAIELVRSGWAVRIHLVNLSAPLEAAADGASRAADSGVELHVDRSSPRLTVTVGPIR